MSDTKYQKLAKNTMIFGLGMFGSRVLQFLIVPLYSYVLSTEEYGRIDLFTSTISLMLPFVTLLIHESIIRFLTAKEIKNEEAINTGGIVFILSIILSICGSLIFYVVSRNHLSHFFFVCLMLQSYTIIFQNYLKASGDIAAFTICGVLNTLVFLISNVVFLAFLQLGMDGYIYSIVLSQSVLAVFITIRGKIFEYISFKQIKFKVLKEMMKYSIPLIPNNLMWWLMNAGDKYIINYFLGDSANGIYSMAMKIATIITTIFGIFMQAWQISAIEEYGKDDKATFFSRVFLTISSALLLAVCIINLITRPLYRLIINNTFYSSSFYSPILCVATVLNCLSTFFGITYIVNKNTKRSFWTTFLGAIVNLITNVLLVKRMGLTGVALGTIIGYLSVIALRINDTRKTIKISIYPIKLILSLIIILVCSYFNIYLSDKLTFALSIACLIMVIIVFKNEYLYLFKKIALFANRRK